MTLLRYQPIRFQSENGQDIPMTSRIVGRTVVLCALAGATCCGPKTPPGSPQSRSVNGGNAYRAIEPPGVPWPPPPSERAGWLGSEGSSFELSKISEGASYIGSGCPFKPALVPACPEDIDAITTNEAWDRHAETDGHVVTVIGPVVEDSGSGLEQPKIGKRVCAVMGIGIEWATVYLSPRMWQWDGTAPTPFWCCGDVDAMCCGVAWTVSVVARGVYRWADPTNSVSASALEQPLLCDPRPGTLRALRPPQGGSP